MKITDKLREIIIQTLDDGHSISSAARLVGCSRQALYRHAEGHPDLAAAMKKRGLKPESFDDPEPGDLELLSAQEVRAFVATLVKTRSLRQAARAARVSLGGKRIEVEKLTRHQRDRALAFLRSLDTDDEKARAQDPALLARDALDRWLAGDPWPSACNLDAKVLASISKRALDSYEAHCLVIAAERAANDGQAD